MHDPGGMRKGCQRAPRDARATGQEPGAQHPDKARRSPFRQGCAAASEAQLLARLAALEGERDALAAEVQGLQQRCRQLEEATSHVRNRLAWAIDSVESVLQNKVSFLFARGDFPAGSQPKRDNIEQLQRLSPARCVQSWPRDRSAALRASTGKQAEVEISCLA